MTDVVQAREAAVAAETKAEAFFNDVLDKLHEQNSRLLELHGLIKAAQPVASGAVCLELYLCGADCTGCPHPRWVKYFWPDTGDTKQARLVSTNLDSQGRDPVLALHRKEPFYPALVALIREAKSILKDRSALLSAIRSLRNAAKRK